MTDDTNNTIDPKFFNQVSQIAHFFTTYAITFTFYALWGHKLGLPALVMCWAYAAVHEFWWDPREENAATRGSDLEDFIFLTVGATVAFLICLFKFGWR